MATDVLANIASGADVFLDANIFIYGFTAASPESERLLVRCANQDIFGITSLEIIHELVATMEEYGIQQLASHDSDFDRINTLIVYHPTDIP